jgi:uncharacterized protein YqjF (DUF2071 family)
MKQQWHDLLFAHWPVPVTVVQRLVPRQLAVDSFDGRAWVGVVPFRMAGVRPRGVPPLPGLSAFPELNVRTYVHTGGKAGVYFFSLDATNRVAVAAARRFFHLPYHRARMASRDVGGTIEYRSRRTHRGSAPAEFIGRYRPVSPPRVAERGSIDHWLTERYCLYTTDARGSLRRGEVHHAPWPLQAAEAEIERNTMAAAGGIELPGGPPLLHFARRLDVLIWPLTRVDGAVG